MPYLGTLDGTRVIPPQVDDGMTVTCPVCERPMTVVTSHERNGNFISRHFRHHEQVEQSRDVAQEGQLTFDDLWRTGNCPGESDEHLKMKSIAYARLVHDFPDADVDLESGVDGRIADVLVTFPKPRAPYGKGIAVEAQYRNHGKDIAAVTDHYLQREYSVGWITEADISGHDIDLSGMLTVWPHALPARTGTEGYPDVIRWLWQDKSAPVKLQIPIPAAFWMSYSKEEKWVPVVTRRLQSGRLGRGGAWIQVSRSPSDDLVLQLSKKHWQLGSSTKRVTVQLAQDDIQTLETFAEQLAQELTSDSQPHSKPTDGNWTDVATAWLTGSSQITAWLSGSYPPSGNLVVTLGKKHPVETSTVSVQIDERTPRRLQDLIQLIDRAFRIEHSSESFGGLQEKDETKR